MVLYKTISQLADGSFALTHDSLELLDKVSSLLLIIHYLLLEIFPGLRAVLVGDADYLMDGLVNLLFVARIDHNASLVEDFL